MSKAINGADLTVSDVLKVARFEETVTLAPEARERLAGSRRVVEKYLQEARIAYGVTTGVGKLYSETVSPVQASRLQRNIAMSHACGVGEPLTPAEVRAIMMVRANMLALGYSGVSPAVVEALLAMLNAGISPVIPSGGGVGSSGSLSTGAHLALALTGTGNAFVDGEVIPIAEALHRRDLSPLVLQAKDCLSLINGTHVACGIAALALADLANALKSAEAIAVMSFEALRGNVGAFDARIGAARLHDGQRVTIRNLQLLLGESPLLVAPPARVQDPYSLRCIPQIHGGVRETLRFTLSILEHEMNSAVDNPLVFPDDEVIISGGNFHGQIPALAIDFTAIACAAIANLSERRISRLLDTQSSGLPAFLAPQSGLNSGFMIAQYVAASLVSEIRLLAGPVSVDSIPTSGGQEDVVSNCTIAARKLGKAVGALSTILGIELLCAAQALDMGGGAPGLGAEAALRCIRRSVPSMDEDRILEPDINKAAQIVSSGELVQEVERRVGALG